MTISQDRNKEAVLAKYPEAWVSTTDIAVRIFPNRSSKWGDYIGYASLDCGQASMQQAWADAASRIPASPGAEPEPRELREKYLEWFRTHPEEAEYCALYATFKAGAASQSERIAKLESENAELKEEVHKLKTHTPWSAGKLNIDLAELREALKETDECVRKMLNGNMNPIELNPQSWAEALRAKEK